MSQRLAPALAITALAVLALWLAWARQTTERKPPGEPAPAGHVQPTGVSARDGNRSGPAARMESEPGSISGSVVFNGHRLAVSADAGAVLARVRAALSSNETRIAALAFPAVPSPGERAALAREGVHLLSYIGAGAWIARVGAGTSIVPRVTLFRPFDASLRVAGDLAEPGECDTVPVYVHVVRDRRAADVLGGLHATAYAELGAHQSGPVTYLAGRVPRERLSEFLEEVSAHPDVQRVARGAGARLMNFSSMRILQSGSYAGATPIFARGIYGSNQVIAVCDTGVDTDNCFFRDTSGMLPPTNRIDGTNVNLGLRKVIACDFLYGGDDPASPTAWDNQGHGTHVAGDALGSDISNPLGANIHNGMAPAAKLVMQDAGFTTWDHCADLPGLGCPVTNYLPALRQARAQGARIHNNSWGDNEDGVFTNLNAYTLACAELDWMTWSNRDFLVVCAAGNAGANDTVSSPSTAKNGLSVAATEPGSAQESIALFSSRGCTADGRIKPDLAAPGGHNIYASSSDNNITTSNCTTDGGGGTSYASPLVCGLAALVRDYLAQGYYPSRQPAPTNAILQPSAALVKAMLVNSCVAMSNAVAPPPARDQGWGRPNLSAALAFTDSVHRLFVADAPARFDAAPALPYVTHLRITSTGVPLKVTLAWSDYPATVGVAKQLVNDVDLLVRAPGQTFRGNVFSNGWAAAGGSHDRSNNVEQVVWRYPSTGIVEVSVWAHEIPEPTQDFAVAAAGAFELMPDSRDDDADGLSDWWELWHFRRLDATSATNDTDSDGASDLHESLAGTDPTNGTSAPVIRLRYREDDIVEIETTTARARRYDIWFSDGDEFGSYSDAAVFGPYSNLAEGAGMHLTGSPDDLEDTFVFQDDFSVTNSGGPPERTNRFYRIRVQRAGDL